MSTLKGPHSRYEQRGVASQKSDVHAAVDALDRGLFPNAFCKITEDILTDDPDKCSVIHSDGSGTKSIVAYLHFRETGDPTIFRGIAQDSIVMNLDDLLCVGVTGSILISNTINRNARVIPRAVLQELILGAEVFLEHLRSLGIRIYSGGGETADVGDLTGTVTVDSCAVTLLRKSEIIDGSGIEPDLAIIGLAAYGKTNYESYENSGIGSNGLTSARHDLLSSFYRETYPETVDVHTERSFVYAGPYRLQDPLPQTKMKIGEALLSPTRTYAPVIQALLSEHRPAVRGLVHCSGGGQTKCLRFGKRLHFVKDHLLPIPPLFTTLQSISQTPWKEMYQTYNMGHRMELFCRQKDVDRLLAVIRDFELPAQVIGYTEASRVPLKRNHLTLHNGSERLTYASE